MLKIRGVQDFACVCFPYKTWFVCLFGFCMGNAATTLTNSKTAVAEKRLSFYNVIFDFSDASGLSGGQFALSSSSWVHYKNGKGVKKNCSRVNSDITSLNSLPIQTLDSGLDASAQFACPFSLRALVLILDFLCLSRDEGFENQQNGAVALFEHVCVGWWRNAALCHRLDTRTVCILKQQRASNNKPVSQEQGRQDPKASAPMQ